MRLTAKTHPTSIKVTSSLMVDGKRVVGAFMPSTGLELETLLLLLKGSPCSIMQTCCFRIVKIALCLSYLPFITRSVMLMNLLPAVLNSSSQ